MAERGENPHGEVDFLERMGATSVLDAGCGTGRVAIELAHRGHDVVGVDQDPDMLGAARQNAPEVTWVESDLVGLDLGRTFDTAVMAGNVMIFVEPGTEPAVIERVAQHLGPGGRLVAGFQLRPGGLDLGRYDEGAALAGLTLADRYSSWDGDPWADGGDYAVSVHTAPRSRLSSCAPGVGGAWSAEAGRRRGSAMMQKPAAQILLERYWEDVNNGGDVELLRELCADPIIRHDPGQDTTLSHQEQIDRIRIGVEMGIKIDRVVTHANDEWVTSVWNMHSEAGVDGMTMCGIEVFKVEDGVLAHAWNTPYAEGHWLDVDV